MYYQADWLLSMADPPRAGGWLRIEGDRIAALGSGKELPVGAEVRRFPGVLMPGLINAHCHLELSGLGGLPRLPFTEWVKALREATEAYTPTDYQNAAQRGIAELIRGGSTTVVDVGNTGAAPRVLAESPLRAFALVETLGLDPAAAGERFREALAKTLPTTFPRLQGGLAPHSAYACSPALLASVVAHQRKLGSPLTFHAAESREEAELFASGSGSLRDFCRSVFPDAPDHAGTTPIRYLDSLDLLPEGALIVHGNYLEDGDISILARRHAVVVHCPSSHAFFGHAVFPYARLREKGVPVVFGTDSSASSDSLSMLRQLRSFHLGHPGVEPKEVLAMATAVAAVALGLENQIGILRPGFAADFVVIQGRMPISGDPHQIPLENGAETALTVIAGNEIML